MKGCTIIVAVCMAILLHQTNGAPCMASSSTANSQQQLKNCYKNLKLRANVLKQNTHTAAINLGQTFSVNLQTACLKIISIQKTVQRGMNIVNTNNLTTLEALRFHKAVLTRYNSDLQSSVLKVPNSLRHVKQVLRDTQAVIRMIDLAVLNMQPFTCQSTNVQIPAVTNAQHSLVCRTIDLNAFATTITLKYIQLYKAA